MSFLRFRRRPRDPILAADWNDVLAELDRRLGIPSSGRRARRSAPGGDIAFEVSLSQKDGKWEARFERGLIAGFEMTIEKIKASEVDPKTGLPPALVIDPVKDINPDNGTGHIYAQLNLRPDWSVGSIVPACFAKPPDSQARKWKAYKLLAIVTRTPAPDPAASLEAWQAVEHNLGWAAIQRRASGDARHLFWATS